jgi:cytochrome P450
MLLIYVFLFSGYLIPKGWRIYVYTREINYDTFLYPDPLTFNPWRWMVSTITSLFLMHKKNSISLY